jgi:hypothetical protein
MRCNDGAHRFYCGVDRQARTMYAHVLDDKATTDFEPDLPGAGRRAAAPKATATRPGWRRQAGVGNRVRPGVLAPGRPVWEDGRPGGRRPTPPAWLHTDRRFL